MTHASQETKVRILSPISIVSILFLGYAPSAPQDAGIASETSGERHITALVSEDSVKKSKSVAGHSDMVRIEGGSFEMGGDVDKPIHVVTLAGYYMDKYEVTVGEYRKFCEATSRSMPSPPDFGWTDKCPIIGVTWNDAREYAIWAGKRLPTEAEWEFAARGGVLSKGYRYSGSDDPGKVAWYDANSQKTTHPVGTKEPNELGIYDLSGNAAEWCSDYYGGTYYGRSPRENPKGPTSGSDRVVRGGSFMGDQYDCQISFRRSVIPTRNSMRNGFRCALDE